MSDQSETDHPVDERPFAGIRVYDASQGVAGPHASMLLALHGADVVKVEPLDGDWGRVLGKTRGEHCAHSIAFNRGKRSIAFDAKSEEGREIARRLVASSDVFIESFRPGAAARLGLSYDAVREVNPKVVYASVSGFGQTGPWRERPAVDGLIQAFSGMMIMNRTPDGAPHRLGMVAVDGLTGLYAFQAISAALMRQVRFGRGSYIDASLMQAAAAYQAAKIIEHHAEDGKPEPLYVPAGMVRTADGHMVVSGMRHSHFVALCEAMERPDLAQSPDYATQELRTAHAGPLMAEMTQEFLKRTTADWLGRLHAVGVLAENIQDYDGWLENEHVQAVKAYEWADYGDFGQLPIVNIPGTPRLADAPELARAPLIGEDSRAILGDLGFGEGEIETMIGKGRVRA